MIPETIKLPCLLIDLDPLWFSPDGKREGLDFRCPHCTERIRIFFSNPFDGGKQRGDSSTFRWEVIGGSGFGDLSLRPSVDWKGHCHIDVSMGRVNPD